MKMSAAKPLVVACIPAYNEEKTIAKVVLQTKKYVDKVLVCDDGSTDISDELAEQGSKMLFQSWLRTMHVFSRIGV